MSYIEIRKLYGKVKRERYYSIGVDDSMIYFIGSYILMGTYIYQEIEHMSRLPTFT